MDRDHEGSKILALTPIILPGFGPMGSQCVTQPQVLHLTKRKVRSPQMYPAVAPRFAVTLTAVVL